MPSLALQATAQAQLAHAHVQLIVPLFYRPGPRSQHAGLLAAVTAANAAADADIIYVTGNITVTAQLPALAPPLTIDGSQAPGGRGALTGPGGAFTLFGGAPAGVALTDLLIRGAALGAAGGTLTRLELDGGGFATAGPAILGSGNALNPLTLSDVVIRGYDGGASPTSYGGALLVQYSAVVTAVRCSFENNKAEYGGAVAVSNFATFSCAECTCAGNAADVIPGAAGGCLYGALSSNVTMSRCTISGNRATAGGGVYARGALALRQSTLSGNAASGSAGGVTVDGGQLARALLSSCTVTGHTSTTGATAFAIGGGVPFEIVNSIIQCQAPCVAFLGASTVTVSHSIIPAGWEGYGGAGNLAAPPLLGPLQDNGGPTRTHALLAGSPAVNAGDASKLDASDASDQRGPGFPRVAAGGLDMGALEMQPPTVSQLSLRTFKNTVLVASLLPAVKAGDSAVASIASLAAQGAAGGRVAVAPATGSLTYTPAFKFVNGNDTFTLEATGADALKAAGTITVTVGAPPARGEAPAHAAACGRMQAHAWGRKRGDCMRND